MSIEENKAVVRRSVEALNTQDVAVHEALSGSPEALRVATESIQWISATFERHHIAITDMIAEADKVWARVSTRGRHTGEFAGIPPTGKEWTNTGILFYRLADGKVLQIDMLFDVLNHVTQLGATITPPV